MAGDWSGLSFQERRVSGQSNLVFGVGLLMVFLVLAAQFESFLLPAIVLVTVPLESVREYCRTTVPAALGVNPAFDVLDPESVTEGPESCVQDLVTVPLVPPKVANVQLPAGGSCVVALQQGEAMRSAPRQYLNRLSDLLFVLARQANLAKGDILWIPGGGT